MKTTVTILAMLVLSRTPDATALHAAEPAPPLAPANPLLARITAQCNAFSDPERRIGCYDAITAAQARRDVRFRDLNAACGGLAWECYEAGLKSMAKADAAAGSNVLPAPVPQLLLSGPEPRAALLRQACGAIGAEEKRVKCHRSGLRQIENWPHGTLIAAACGAPGISRGACFDKAFGFLAEFRPPSGEIRSAALLRYQAGLLAHACTGSTPDPVSRTDCFRGGLQELRIDIDAAGLLLATCSSDAAAFNAPCIEAGLVHINKFLPGVPFSTDLAYESGLVARACTGSKDMIERTPCFERGIRQLLASKFSTLTATHLGLLLSACRFEMREMPPIGVLNAELVATKECAHTKKAHYVSEQRGDPAHGPARNISCQAVPALGKFWELHPRYENREPKKREGDIIAGEENRDCYTCLQCKGQLDAHLAQMRREDLEKRAGFSPACFERGLGFLTREAPPSRSCEGPDVLTARFIQTICASNDAPNCATKLLAKIEKRSTFANILANCRAKEKTDICVESSLSVLITSPELVHACLRDKGAAVEAESPVKKKFDTGKKGRPARREGSGKTLK